MSVKITRSSEKSLGMAPVASSTKSSAKSKQLSPTPTCHC